MPSNLPDHVTLYVQQLQQVIILYLP